MPASKASFNCCCSDALHYSGHKGVTQAAQLYSSEHKLSLSNQSTLHSILSILRNLGELLCFPRVIKMIFKAHQTTKGI